MENITLKAKTRKETGKKIKQLRQQGKIPAVLYGHGVKNVNLSVPEHVFEKTYQQAGESTLVDLIVDDKKPVKVLIQEVQADPVKGNFIHVDFHQVRMTEKLEAEIELKFVNEAPAVKELDGVLVTNLDTLEVKCYPQDLVPEIEVDLSSLKTFEDHIYVKDLKVPAKIEVLANPDEVVASVSRPRTEEELKELEEKPEAEKEAAVVGEAGEAKEGGEVEKEEAPAEEGAEEKK